jgi:uncharacterized protein (DUF1330 family)
MAADGRRHVILLGVEVVDQAGYARYRAEMTPILASYGGSFGVDLVVARVLQGGGDARPNRVFTVVFPDRQTRERFFADTGYRAVRTAYFEPAVARTVMLGEYDEAVRLGHEDPLESVAHRIADNGLRGS